MLGSPSGCWWWGARMPCCWDRALQTAALTLAMGPNHGLSMARCWWGARTPCCWDRALQTAAPTLAMGQNPHPIYWSIPHNPPSRIHHSHQMPDVSHTPPPPPSSSESSPQQFSSVPKLCNVYFGADELPGDYESRCASNVHNSTRGGVGRGKRMKWQFLVGHPSQTLLNLLLWAV